MGKDQGVFMKQGPDFSNPDSAQYIANNLYQKVSFPKEYPAIVLVHQEQPAQKVPYHWHSGPELIYTRNREITVTVDGVKNVVCPGEFILISSFALHAVVPSPDDIRQDVLGVTFQGKHLESVCPGIGGLHISRDADGATDDAKQQMIQMCEQLRRHIERDGVAAEMNFKTNAILYAMLDSMYSEFRIKGTFPTHQKREQLNKLANVLNYIEEHYRDDLSTQSIANEFGYSREYFCRFFKNYANQTFKKYLLDKRLDAAVAELQITNKAVGHIAMESGFPNEKAFYIAFKKKYDMSPAQFRKMLEPYN